MKKQMIWGLAILILLLGAAAVYIILDQHAELRQLEQDVVDADKLLERHNKQKAQLPTEKETPIDTQHPQTPHRHADGSFHDPSAQPSQVSQTDTSPLTFHEELLKTNPVKALHLQSEERGHWSARWIPPFPPDDQEAAAIARNIYISAYYKSRGEMDTPKSQQLREEYMSHLHAIMEYPLSTRRSDLLKLTWTILSIGDVVTGFQPSDYSLPRK